MIEQRRTIRNASVYFKNITSLRFFAALLVFCSHLEYLKMAAGLPDFYSQAFFREAGHLGVVCFFVLSGFLITYLLLQEQKVFKKVHIAKFYLRRVLRIWPLYFLILLSGFIIFPLFVDDLTIYRRWENLILCVLFLPNLAHILYGSIPLIGQIWSIGVEEQFYLFWPWLMRSGNLLKTILIFLATFWFLKFILIVLSNFYNSPFISVPLGYVHISSYDSLIIGSLGAWLVFHKNTKILPVIFSRWFQYSFYFLLILMVSTGFYFPYVHTQFYSFVFLILILNLAANPLSIITLEYPFLSYLGKISYSIYMFHLVGITIGIKLRDMMSLKPGLADVLLSLAATILLSVLSYELFEKRFLRLKNRFEFILTTEKATRQEGIS